MNNFQLRNILMMAAAYYPDVLAVLVEMLRRNAANLGLMAPGIPDQLAVSNGVDVTANGLPLYYAVVKRRGDMFRSPMALAAPYKMLLTRLHTQIALIVCVYCV